MKKIFLGFTVMCIMMLSLCFGVSAETCDDYEYYLKDDGTVSITDYTGSAENLIIPSTLDGKKVTGIADSAFSSRRSIKSVKIPDSVTSIGYRAFGFSNYIETVEIGSGVSEIEETAFGYCYSLKKIIVNENNKYFSSSSDGVLFNKDKTKLIQYNINSNRTTYTVPSSVTSIGGYAFMDADKLETIIVPSSVNDIGHYAFNHCKVLKTININGKISSINNGTFYYCTKLETVNISACSSTIGSEAFEECSSLKSFVIPNGVTDIENSAFNNCTSLSVVTIPNTVTYIGNYAFYNTALTAVTIPESVTHINHNAFGNTKLSSIFIPKNVSYLNNNAFNECQQLEKVNVSSENKYYISQNNIVYSKDMTELIFFPLNYKITTYNIPEGVEKALSLSLDNVVSLTIPSSLTSLEILSCENLKEINVHANNPSYCVVDGVLFSKDKTKLIKYPPASTKTEYTVPKGVKTIEGGAFSCCDNLKSVIVSEGVTTIEIAFNNCINLKNIIVPSSITEFNLENFTCGSSTSQSIENIYYKGTQTQWDAIKKHSYYNGTAFPNATIHYNYAYDHFHSYKSKTVKSTTCKAEGKMSYTCSVCGYSYTKTIKKSVHESVTDNAVAATYKSTGLTEGSHCSVCNQILVKQKSVKRLSLKKVTKLKAKTIKTTSIKFTWSKVTGAENYEIYYSTNGKKWTKKTSSKNSITIKKLKAGTTYKVKVRAVAGSNKGSYSSVLTASTKPSKVALSKLTAGKKKLTAQWKTVSGVSGYQVAYSTSKKFSSKTTKKVTVKKAKTKKTTLKNLKSGEKYYVKVRAYKTVNGKKIYGAYSSVKTITVK